MSIYDFAQRLAEATQLPETALIFYLVILWSSLLSAATFQNVNLITPHPQILICYLGKSDGTRRK